MAFFRTSSLGLALVALALIGCDDGLESDAGPVPTRDSGDPCTDVIQCAEADARCEGDVLVLCAPDADGCLVETDTDCATAGGRCDDSGPAPMCVEDPCASVPTAERCDAEVRECAADALEICAPNADGCLVREVTDCAAAPGGACARRDGEAMCVLPPDPCAGIADACAVEGASCEGDTLIRCAPNAFGCLVRTRADCASRAGGSCDASASPAVCAFTSDPCDGVAECPSAEARCDGPALVRCARDAFGCLTETRTTCTDTMFGFCDAEAAPPLCATAATDPCMGMAECAERSRACDGQVLDVCAPNEFGCLTQRRTDCAASGQLCRAPRGRSPSCRTDSFYFEDFEAGPGGWTPGGVNATWAHGPGRDSDGELTQLLATNPLGTYDGDERSFVTSPAIDLSAATADPVLRFRLLRSTESCCDRGWAEISTDGGTTFTKLGMHGEGLAWYNDASNEWWDGTNAGWEIAQIPLPGTAGDPDVRLRFRMASDGSVNLFGFAIDEIEVLPTPTVDLAARRLDVGDECPQPGDAVSLDVINLGETAVSSFDVELVVDGGAPVVETLTVSLPPGAERTVTLSATVDLTAAGPHDVRATVLARGDEVPRNDTQRVTQDGLTPLGAGYVEDFEGSDGGWDVGGQFPSWSHGAPAGTVIASAASGSEAWVTDLSGDYFNQESSWVRSLCFDFRAAATDPTLAFGHIYETEACCDRGWIEVWTVSTGTWTRLGDGTLGTNWYDDLADVAFNGTSGGSWRTASHPLTGTAGETAVRIRHVFDSDRSATAEGFGLDDVTITP